jgi:beta-lactam-binding protein with PASTA domain
VGVPRDEEDTEFIEPGEEGWPVRDEASPLAGPAPAEAPAPPARRSARFLVPWLPITLLLVALAAAGGGAAVAMFGHAGGEAPATVEAAAKTPAKPYAKKHAPSTTTSTTASTTTGRADVPDLVGITQAKATNALTTHGFKAKVQLVVSDGPPGRVLRQEPAGEQAPEGSTIVLSVSKARPKPPTVTVPDVVGLSTSGAESAVRSRGLAVEVRQVPSDLELGRVVSQWPSAATQLPKGRTVLVNVSQSRPLVSVPGVLGDDQGTARGELSGAGFAVSVQTREVTDPEKDGVVVAQSPSPGAKRKHGATVTVTVGDYFSG